MTDTYMRRITHQEVADVLQLVLQHCTAASQIPTLCNLLLVSRTVQQAVQRAAGRCSLVIPGAKDEAFYDGQIRCCDLTKLAACCSWLPKHAGLIKKLTFGVSWAVDSGLSVKDVTMAHHMVCFALQLCAARAQAAADALPWQLQSLTLVWESPWPGSVPSILDCLPTTLSVSTGLTHLDLTYSLDKLHHQATLYTAIGRLPGLQQLVLHHKAHESYGAPSITLGVSFAEGIKHSTCLQGLKLSNVLLTAGAQALPASLQALTLMLGTAEDRAKSAMDPLDLQHLSNLQALELQCNPLLLPPHPALVDASDGVVLEPAGLQHLTSLHIVDGFVVKALVAQLSSLPHLQMLGIGLQGALYKSVDELRACFAEVTAATQLTQLRLFGHRQKELNITEDNTPLHGVKLHRYLQDLTQLQHLQLANLAIQPDDVANFTVLKTLTALRMSDCRSIGSIAPAAAACSLPNLLVLELVGCKQEDRVLWLLGMATGLERLCFEHVEHYNAPELDDTAMGFLSGLTKLTSLIGPCVPSMYREEYAAFRAAMPALVEAPEAPLADPDIPDFQAGVPPHYLPPPLLPHLGNADLPFQNWDD